MNLIIIGGFLGAGKTSLLLQLAKYLTAQAPHKENRLAIIENEIGDIGVDDQTLGGSGGYTVQSLFSGCVCCTLTGELLGSLNSLQEELNPDYVIIEPSGVADPGMLASKMKEFLDCSVHVVSIVDAERWPKLVRVMGPLLANQTDAADVVFINKVDKVDTDLADSIKNDVRTYNDHAPIVRICAHKDLNEEVLRLAVGSDQAQ